MSIPMTKTVTTPYDGAEHLHTSEEMAVYPEACREESEGDAALIAKALDNITRARSMSQPARDANLQ